MEALEFISVCEGTGFVIVKTAHATEIAEQYEPYEVLSAIETWGEFRNSVTDQRVVVAVVEGSGYDFAEFVSAIEKARGVGPTDGTLQERWIRLAGVPFDGGCDGEYPADDDSFEYGHGEYGLDMEWENALRCAMIEDLPEAIFDEFDLIVDTSLDGALGFVWPEQLDDVTQRLKQLGYTFE